MAKEPMKRVAESDGEIPVSKRIASVLKTAAGKPDPKYFTSAVIVAAGSSTRMGGGSKQMMMLAGIPVIVHTLRAFDNTPCIHEIVVVAKESEIPLYDELIRAYGIKKISAVVKGGETRQESVRLGLDAVYAKSAFIAISDGARCLVTEEMITRVCRNAYLHGGATAATRATDSVKIAEKSAFIASSTERSLTWLAQTPQVFKTNLYRAAAYTALETKFEATDDNSLVENIEYPVKLVDCGRENIKITTEEDLYLAEAILRYRRDKLAKTEPLPKSEEADV
jgi:2-C-methyl-D-erythritol 4-phosphate cytidylyltransferase